MLRALALRDFVIVETLDLELATGFTALTGETGAGKSILVDALGLVLGARADPGVIRPGAERADLSAEFDVSGLEAARRWLEANDLEEEGGESCLLRRTIDRTGRSRGFVNGRPATATQLRELGDFLVDVHGQHEHQWLSQRDYQRRLLDVFGGAEAEARETARLHGEWRRAAQARAARERASESSAREREFLRDEIRDLETLAFTPESWAQESTEHRRLAHAQELIAHCRAAVEAADEAEPSATGLIANAVARLAQAAQVDATLEEARRDLETAAAHAAEAAHHLRRYLQGIEPDPARLDALERRLRLVHDASRRLRVEPAGLPEALASRRARLAEIGGDGSSEALRERETAAGAAYREAAGVLSSKRRDAARRMGEEVTKRLQGLAMEGGRLEVSLEPLPEPAAHGHEGVEFRVAAHAGQPAGPVGKVASGGELSRLALAIQVLMGGRAGIPTLVFDEVDAGIGGRVAEIVGSLLAELSRHHQVLCVTHLPQVAAFARHQLRVAKLVQPRGTLAAVDVLDAAGRIEEIARMLGGARITETTRRHAEEMLGQGAASVAEAKAGTTSVAGRVRQRGRSAH
ncbi:MAG: DNA repair protein RecN [Betaproteobacteria bacterium]|nr:DNA repair protein RecN [Betaproteobacteria bacterium]